MIQSSKTENFLELFTELSTLESIDDLIILSSEKLKEFFDADDCFFSIADSDSQEAGVFRLALRGRLIGSQILINHKKEIPELFSKTYPLFISSLLDHLQSINDLKQENQKLLDKDQIKTELMSTISHELRTPMTNIIGFCELLINKDFDSKQQKSFIQEIFAAAQRLAKLIDNFLDFSRIENNNNITFNHFEEAELDWLAHKAWQELGSSNKTHKIIWDFPEKLPHTYCDPEAITRVFINLFSNAIKYSQSDITCSIRVEDKFLIASIQDKGPGIAEDILDRIFEKFYRGSETKDQPKNGSGLGLWICKEIIKVHQGDIWCDSQAGKGARFAFKLKVWE